MRKNDWPSLHKIRRRVERGNLTLAERVAAGFEMGLQPCCPKCGGDPTTCVQLPDGYVASCVRCGIKWGVGGQMAKKS